VCDANPFGLALTFEFSRSKAINKEWRNLTMGIFTSETFNSLADLFKHELKDLYDAEHRITKALPQMAEKAHHPELKRAFQSHLQQTEKHIERLNSVFEHLGENAERHKCDAMAGLIKEGGYVLSAEGCSDTIDAALIAAAQKVEHYEIASYGTARALALQLNDTYAAELLQDTLDEEKDTDVKLTQIAEGAVNPAAV
jgi:ferritin-like metal-binding protein YciE